MNLPTRSVAMMILFALAAAAAAAAVGQRSTAAQPTSAPASPPAGRALANSVGMNLVPVEPGEFLMGTPETELGHESDEIQHPVRLTRPFLLQTTDVTRAQFAQFVRESGYVTEAEAAKDPLDWRHPGIAQADDHPVVRVTWNDAVAYCRWLAKKEDKPYRLPTEAEWEYACRAGTTSPFWTGDTITTDQANFDGSKKPYGKSPLGLFRKTTTPTGSLAANPWGLYDMHGNVWQWCADAEVPYAQLTGDDPRGPAEGKTHIQRGGAWNLPAKDCRSGNRYRKPTANRDDYSGFRVAMDR